MGTGVAGKGGGLERDVGVGGGKGGGLERDVGVGGGIDSKFGGERCDGAVEFVLR